MPDEEAKSLEEFKTQGALNLELRSYRLRCKHSSVDSGVALPRCRAWPCSGAADIAQFLSFIHQLSQLQRLRELQLLQLHVTGYGSGLRMTEPQLLCFFFKTRPCSEVMRM